MTDKATIRKYLGEQYSRTSFYGRWMNMKNRCFNPNCTDYHNYGGRGIKVCDRWSTFEGFFEDNYTAYIKANEQHSDIQLDRINNDGNYEPSNTRWVPRSHNAQNKRKRQGTYSKHQGVTWNKKNKNWMCNFMFNRKRVYLGSFTDEEDAAIMYNVGVQLFFGSQAKRNAV